MMSMRAAQSHSKGAEVRARSDEPSSRLLAIALGLLLCLAFLLVHGQVSAEGFESDIMGELVVKFGEYRPDIDSEFSGGSGPYSQFFGSGGSFFTELEYSHYLWRVWGALGVGGAVGFASSGGKGRLADGSESVDETELNIVPLRVSLSYRLDMLARQYSIPLVPYASAGLDWYLWWINSAAGIATYRNPDTDQIEEGRGQTFGWHVALGLQFLLDVLAPRMARTFDVNTGVNNSYIFAEYLLAEVSDFGSDHSFDLGDDAFLFGVAFEF